MTTRLDLNSGPESVEKQLDQIVKNHNFKVPSGWGNIIAGAIVPTAVSALVAFEAANDSEAAKMEGINKMTRAASYGGLVLAVSTVAAAATWGASRLLAEGYNQLLYPNDANIGENFKHALSTLQEKEKGVFTGQQDYLGLLKKLESAALQEGQKTSPNLDVMKQNLLKAKILREAMCAELSDQKQIDSIMDASTQVIDKFYAWANIQEERELSPGANVLAALAAGTVMTCVQNDPMLQGLSTLMAGSGAIQGLTGYLNRYVFVDQYQDYLKRKSEVKVKEVKKPEEKTVEEVNEPKKLASKSPKNMPEGMSTTEKHHEELNRVYNERKDEILKSIKAFDDIRATTLPVKQAGEVKAVKPSDVSKQKKQKSGNAK